MIHVGDDRTQRHPVGDLEHRQPEGASALDHLGVDVREVMPDGHAYGGCVDAGQTVEEPQSLVGIGGEGGTGGEQDAALDHPGRGIAQVGEVDAGDGLSMPTSPVTSSKSKSARVSARAREAHWSVPSTTPRIFLVPQHSSAPAIATGFVPRVGGLGGGRACVRARPPRRAVSVQCAPRDRRPHSPGRPGVEKLAAPAYRRGPLPLCEQPHASRSRVQPSPDFVARDSNLSVDTSGLPCGRDLAAKRRGGSAMGGANATTRQARPADRWSWRGSTRSTS